MRALAIAFAAVAASLWVAGSGPTETGRTSYLELALPTATSETGAWVNFIDISAEGRHIVVDHPDAPWDRPVITTFDYGEYSIRDERFRYIRYIDGGEELYDHDADPEEWTNLADDPAYAEVKSRLNALIPKDPAPFVDTSFEILPHHNPPIRSLEDYLSRKR